MLNTILFDLDNTLLDRNGAFQRCLDEHFRDPLVREQLLKLDNNGYESRELLWNAWEQHSGRRIDQIEFAELLSRQILPNRSLLETIQQLSARFKIGVITNGGSATQRRKFCAARLDEVIPSEHLWISAEVGMEKPDPAIYHFACRMLSVQPVNCLYISDDPDEVSGAKAIGMKAFEVTRALTSDQLLHMVQGVIG